MVNRITFQLLIDPMHPKKKKKKKKKILKFNYIDGGTLDSMVY
jgi:hypothetical protein